MESPFTGKQVSPTYSWGERCGEPFPFPQDAYPSAIPLECSHEKGHSHPEHEARDGHDLAGIWLLKWSYKGAYLWDRNQKKPIPWPPKREGNTTIPATCTCARSTIATSGCKCGAATKP